MPRKNKKPAPFMSFAMEYKAKQNRKMTQDQAISEAGEKWKNMTENEKSKYKDRAKFDLIKLTQKQEEKLNNQGIPIRFIENEVQEKQVAERSVKSQIKDLVLNSRCNDNFIKQKYYFIMGNYFVRIGDNNVYLPAEIGCSEFSLKEGITNKFHSFINPNIEIYGQTYEAQQYAEQTHKLPLPPKAFGEKDLGKLYLEVLKFICNMPDGNLGTKFKPPPIFTFADNIPAITSILEYLKMDCYENDAVDIQVFPLQYLFYTLKVETAEIAEIDPPQSIYMTDAILERDDYEYKVNLSCNYHDEVDRTMYCALSCAVRWGFIISDNLCIDLAIKSIPGQHYPSENDCNGIVMSKPVADRKHVEPEKYSFDDSWKTNIKMERRNKYEPGSSGLSQGADEFPALGSSKSSKPKRTFY